MLIFISHASEDRDTAEEVHLALIGAGHRTFFDRNDLPAGGDYHARIAEAVARCDAMVFLVSESSIARGSYALTELKHARVRWVHGKGRVLPVLLQPVPFDRLPNYLGAVTVLEPEGNVAAEVVLALGQLALEQSRSNGAPDTRHGDQATGRTGHEPSDETRGPVSPPPLPVPGGTVRAVNYVHNVPVPSPMGPGPGMRIVIDAEITGAAGRTAQLVVKFAYVNGPPLLANAQEVLYRDMQGIVSTGTPPHVVSSSRESLVQQVVTLPYYALNFQPTGGMGSYSLSLTAFVFVDQQIVTQSAPVPFGLRW